MNQQQFTDERQQVINYLFGQCDAYKQVVVELQKKIAELEKQLPQPVPEK